MFFFQISGYVDGVNTVQLYTKLYKYIQYMLSILHVFIFMSCIYIYIYLI